jgi:hypothetical protein
MTNTQKDEAVADAIESHFNFCMNALAARKASLLQELDVKIALKSMFSFLLFVLF